MAATLTRRRAPFLAIALAALLALVGCAGGTATAPRTPNAGELVGTWTNGKATIVLSDGTYEASGIPTSALDGATATGRVSFGGSWSSSSVAFDGYPQLELFLTSGDAVGVGGLQVIFDSTTHPVSIAIAHGDPDDPKFLHLSRH